jgi:uncharacterized protein YjbI with pentapeptide repeats
MPHPAPRPPGDTHFSLTPEQRAPLAARWLRCDDEGVRLRDRALEQLRRGGLLSPGDAPGDTPRDLRALPLAGEDLAGLELAGYDLSWADFTGASLNGARLGGARLVGAVLTGADLEGAELLAADLRGANLNECRAPRVGFGKADLREASLFGAHLQGATFTHSTLAGVDLRAADLTGSRLREADLRGANLSRAVLRGADLGLSRVAGARFDHADLRSARLRALDRFWQASWIGVDLRDVDFTGAYMLRRHVLDENYLFEFRSRGRVSAALYRLWWATSDCGRSLLRWTLCNFALMGLFALIYTRVGLDYGDHPTPLSPLYYSVVTFTTLGFGDVVPATPTAQALAMVEVILGYVGLGGLLAILSNRMARRAD